MEDEDDPFLRPLPPNLTSTPTRPPRTSGGGTFRASQRAGSAGDQGEEVHHGPGQWGGDLVCVGEGDEWVGEGGVHDMAKNPVRGVEVVEGYIEGDLDQVEDDGEEHEHRAEGAAVDNGHPVEKAGVGHRGPLPLGENNNLKQMCLLCKEEVDEKNLNQNQVARLSVSFKIVYRYCMAFFVCFEQFSATGFYVKKKYFAFIVFILQMGDKEILFSGLMSAIFLSSSLKSSIRGAEEA